ncbi:MAG: T9SS type A sorting domain-containing protein [Candidatus Zixiibacteriota bacterium]
MKTKVILALFILITGLAFGQPTEVFSDDFEGDVSGWVFEDLNWDSDHYEGDSIVTFWHTSDFEAYEGNSWWCGDSEIEGYDNGWFQALVTPAISLPSGGEPTMTFKSKYAVEAPAEYEGYDGWDAMNVRISIDGGESWEVIEPTGGYPASSCFGFGFNHEGEGVPGWGGISSGFVDEEIDLSDYTGEEVHIAFVFGSDPAFCTVDYGDGDDTYDASLFGWIIDDIVVENEGAAIFSDDGGDSAPSEMTPQNWRRPQFFEISSEDYHSESHSLHMANEFETQTIAYSPWFTIPESFLAEVEYWAHIDLPDDANEEGNLEDYYMVYINYMLDEERDTLVRLHYDYGRNSWLEGWSIMNGDSIFNGILELRGFSGEVRLAFLALSDGNHTNYASDSSYEGSGLWIDDISVSGRTGLMHNVGVSDIATGPINVGVPVRFTATVDNPGLSDESTIMTLWRMYTAGYEDTLDIGFFDYPTIASGEYATVADNYTFDEPGDYIMRVWVSRPGDLDPSDDTLELEFTVPHSHDRYMGYDDGVPGGIDRVTAVRTSGYDETGLAVVFDSPFTNTYLETVKWWTNRTTNIDIALFTTDIDDRPSYGDPFMTIEDITLTPPEGGGWVSYTLDDHYPITEEKFALAILAHDEGDTIQIGTDFSPPFPERSFAREYAPGTGYYWLKFGLGESGINPAFDSTNVLIRCKVNDGESVKEEIVAPKEFGLTQNTPNPFNPSTAISYQLDKEMPVKLTVYNVLGQSVANLVDKVQTEGAYTVRFDAEGLESGVYFYRLETPENIFTKKMMLMQ